MFKYQRSLYVCDKNAKYHVQRREITHPRLQDG